MSSAIKVNFEIGHVASVRSKPTPEGFTHDWEVFLRGTQGVEISRFVEKVVFHLHTSFKIVVKEQPFSVKQSGYLGFTFPMEIHLKNKGIPKKIQLNYDLALEKYGLLRDHYIFQNPNEEFKKKLLNGGGMPVTNAAYYTNYGLENRSKNSFTTKMQHLVSKPMLSSYNIKKYTSKVQKEALMGFEDIFGPLIRIPSIVLPDSKTPSPKTNEENDRSGSDKKPKREHKEPKLCTINFKEDKNTRKVEKKQENTIKEANKRERPHKRLRSPDFSKNSDEDKRKPKRSREIEQKNQTQ